MMKIKFILPIIFCLFSCTNKAKPVNEDYYKASKFIVDKWIGKEMELPKNLNLIIEHDMYGNVSDLYKSNLKIVSYIDGNCSVCIESLMFWKKFYQKLKRKKTTCEIILFIEVDDVDNFKSIIDKIGIDFPCILDKKGTFIAVNELNDQRFQAALLDENNNVILIGNPVLNDELNNLYINTISKIKKTN